MRSNLRPGKSPPEKEDDELRRLPVITPSVQARVPKLWSIIARNVAALSLRDLRRRPGCFCVAGSTSRRQSKLVAGSPAWSDRIWELPLPGIIFFRRQRTAREPRLVDRRWIAER